MTVIINLYGRPGSGKGTFAEVLQDQLGWRVLTMGNVLKAWAYQERTPEQRALAAKLRAGQFASDEQAIACARDWLSELDAAVPGVILDGFPRTLPQLRVWSDLHLPATGVLIDTPEYVCLARLTGRLMCTVCGHTQLVGEALLCKRCGQALKLREEDTVEGAHERLRLHTELVEPVIAALHEQAADFRVINGNTVRPLFEDRALHLGLELMHKQGA